MKIERLRPHSECLLVSYDVTISLYTNMQLEELIVAVETACREFDSINVFLIQAPHTADLSYFFRLILENVFEINLIPRYTNKSLDVQWDLNAPPLYAIFTYIK